MSTTPLLGLRHPRHQLAETRTSGSSAVSLQNGCCRHANQVSNAPRPPSHPRSDDPQSRHAPVPPRGRAHLARTRRHVTSWLNCHSSSAEDDSNPRFGWVRPRSDGLSDDVVDLRAELLSGPAHGAAGERLGEERPPVRCQVRRLVARCQGPFGDVEVGVEGDHRVGLGVLDPTDLTQRRITRRQQLHSRCVLRRARLQGRPACVRRDRLLPVLLRAQLLQVRQVVALGALEFVQTEVLADRSLERRCEGARRRAAWGCVWASRERQR
jgi:hypothetical protein